MYVAPARPSGMRSQFSTSWEEHEACATGLVATEEAVRPTLSLDDVAERGHDPVEEHAAEVARVADEQDRVGARTFGRSHEQ